MIVWPSKDPAESLFCGFDYSNALDAGESISSATVAATLLSGTDASPGDILFGVPTIASGVVLQPFRGGVSGANYKLKCSATVGPTGRVLVLSAKLRVRTE